MTVERDVVLTVLVVVLEVVVSVLEVVVGILIVLVVLVEGVVNGYNGGSTTDGKGILAVVVEGVVVINRYECSGSDIIGGNNDGNDDTMDIIHIFVS